MSGFFDRFWHDRKYLPIIMAGTGAICLVLVFLSVILIRGSAGSPAVAKVSPDEFAQDGADYETDGVYDADETSEPAIWVVYVTGAVARPGVYEIPEGSRVNDAVKTAGGFTSLADPDAVNLAEEAYDGLHVRIPLNGDDAEAVRKDSGAGASARKPPRGAASGKQKAEERININEATAEELQKLPGIGPVLSSAIIAYRETSGFFAETEELMKVNGIGRKRFEAIRDLVTVSR
jgi:competence protein ComEA